MNSVNITGKIGRDLELRVTPGGKSVTEFSVAVKDGKDTHWIDVVAWEKTADNCVEYLHKGSSVGVSGAFQVDQWEKDGQKRSKVKVRAFRVDFLDPKNTESNHSVNKSGGEEEGWN